MTESYTSPRTVISVFLTEDSTTGGVVLRYQKYYAAAVPNVVPLLLQTLNGIHRKLKKELKKFKLYHGIFKYPFESEEWVNIESLLYVNSLSSSSDRSEVLKYELSKIFDDMEVNQVEEKTQDLEDVLLKVKNLLKEN